jgi:hypothetical protein
LAHFLIGCKNGDGKAGSPHIPPGAAFCGSFKKWDKPELAGAVGVARPEARWASGMGVRFLRGWRKKSRNQA